MTDFAKPTTAGDALREAARTLVYRVDAFRREALLATVRADLLESLRYDLEADADRYDQYQPKGDD